MPEKVLDYQKDVKMNDRHDCKCSTDCRRPGGDAEEQEKAPEKVTAAAKAFRAITAVVVFGVPLAIGTASLLAYGVHSVYKRMTGRS
jgi:hypothetical protein